MDQATAIMNGLIAIGAGLAILGGGIGVGIGQGRVGQAALEGMSRNPEMEGPIRNTMFIAMAMFETAVIYGFVISLILVLTKMV